MGKPGKNTRQLETFVLSSSQSLAEIACEDAELKKRLFSLLFKFLNFSFINLCPRGAAVPFRSLQPQLATAICAVNLCQILTTNQRQLSALEMLVDLTKNSLKSELYTYL